MNIETGRNLLRTGALQMGVPLTDEQLDQLLSYYELLAEANKHMNLTAIDDLEGVITRHFLDSFGALCVSETDADGMNVGGQGKERGTDRLEKHLPDKLKKPGMSLIDVGTGAGFPGLPLAIALPELRVTLLDSLNKRVNFLNDVIDKLGLCNTKAIAGRAEDLAKDQEFRGKYDFAVSRAVADLTVLCEYDLPFVKTGGYFLAYKAKGAKEEIERADNALQILCGSAAVAGYAVPGTDITHTIVMIRKTGDTPEKYPRRAGIPSKRPL